MSGETSCTLLCLYVAVPANFSSFTQCSRGPYFTLRTACLLSCKYQTYEYEFLVHNYTGCL